VAGTGNEGAGVLAGVQLEHVDNDYPFEDSHGVLLLPSHADRSKLQNADVTTRDAWLLPACDKRDLGYDVSTVTAPAA